MIHAPETLARQTANVGENIALAAKAHHTEHAPETPGRLRSCARALRTIADELDAWAAREYPSTINPAR